jgi:hypothetical protein
MTGMTSRYASPLTGLLLFAAALPGLAQTAPETAPTAATCPAEHRSFRLEAICEGRP